MFNSLTRRALQYCKRGPSKLNFNTTHPIINLLFPFHCHYSRKWTLIFLSITTESTGFVAYATSNTLQMVINSQLPYLGMRKLKWRFYNPSSCAKHTGNVTNNQFLYIIIVHYKKVLVWRKNKMSEVSHSFPLQPNT